MPSSLHTRLVCRWLWLVILMGDVWIGNAMESSVALCEEGKDASQEGNCSRDEEEEDEGDEDYEKWLWQSGKTVDLQDWLDCDIKPRRRPVHDESIWHVLRTTYQENRDKHEPTSKTLPSSAGNGFEVAVSVDLVDENIGLGIFAQEPIPEDTLIWKSKYTVEFRSGQAFREYLKLLPDDLGCDVLHWAYTRRSPHFDEEEVDDDSFIICCDVDEGSYGNGHYEDDKAVNAVFDDEDDGRGCDLELYADRDISPGEEIRLSYASMEDGWRHLGL
jgi:hypothetical protein